MSKEQQFSELLKRPNINDALVRYREMLDDIRGKLTISVPLGNWKQGLAGEVSPGCKTFHDVDISDVQTVYITWGAPEHLANATWTSATQTLIDASKSYGFTTKGAEVNGPAFSDYNILDAYGAELSLSTVANSSGGAGTTLALTTACHLTLTAHNRGPVETSSSEKNPPSV